MEKFSILIMDGDFTRKRKVNTKSPFEVLYDDVVDPATSQSSKETSGTFPLLEKRVTFGFSGVDDSWETYPQHLWTLFLSSMQ